MPLYDYKCPEHGVFQELAAMADHEKPSFCPQCQTMSARIVLIPPAIAQMIKEKKEAMERNEKAQHAPEFMANFMNGRKKRKRDINTTIVISAVVHLKSVSVI